MTFMSCGVWTMATASLMVDVRLDPLALDVHTPGGRHVCTVGGLDKNHLALTGFVWDAFNTGICRALPDGRPLAVESFALHPQEAIYGFGEQFIRLDKVGQTIDLVMVEAMGVTTPRSYKNVPFYLSTRGYGVFFNHSARMTCWVGSRAAADVQIAIEDDFLDYYLFVGDLQTILARYTDVTGKGRLPPPWSFGLLAEQALLRFGRRGARGRARHARRRGADGRSPSGHPLVRGRLALRPRVRARPGVVAMRYAIEHGDKLRGLVPMSTFSELSPQLLLIGNALHRALTLGGMGFMRGTPSERICGESKVMMISGGAEESMKELAARQLGF